VTRKVQDGHVESEDCMATIVTEHLIQASDVSYPIQHWQCFIGCEWYGTEPTRPVMAASDPSVTWYKGEIGFFNVIPLAQKLDSCGVFGVSSHEYLNYAKANRDEWFREGESLVREHLAEFERMNE
jgi:hypothetical protein